MSESTQAVRAASETSEMFKQINLWEGWRRRQKSRQNSLIILIFEETIVQQLPFFLQSLELSPVSLYKLKPTGFQKYFS